jgi:spore coat polysaccharide biosynthesis predicted glycosyltransferase SpsG
MTCSADRRVRLAEPTLRVLFRAPAGARRGFGHLVRCLSLSRALGVRPLIALRGDAHAADVALSLGAELVKSPSLRTLRALTPDVVVVDDPIATEARRWIRAARRAGALVVTLHDLGLGCLEGDVVIDGSAARAARAPKGSLGLAGTAFAVLDPSLTSRRGDAGVTPTKKTSTEKRVLIALGGGLRARRAEAIARAIVVADPDAHVRIAGGFVAPPRASGSRIRWTTPQRGLAPELAGTDVAIVGGGMSLYEACAMGVPAVALPVVSAQAPTVQAFAQRGAAIAVHSGADSATADIAAAAAVSLLNDPKRRVALARRSVRLVDGRGAWRAAAAVMAAVAKPPLGAAHRG